MLKKAAACLLPILGLLFITAYIRSATTGIVYTDYIRLVNVYLPNVYSLEPYMHADVLTRIPINYIERILNVLLAGYSTTFDMILGAIALSISGFFITAYAAKKNLSVASIGVLGFIWFSLNQWEMLTNGTGWVHFFAFACFIYTYIIFDRIYAGCEKKHDRLKLFVLVPVIMLLVSGPYCVSYGVGLIAIALFCKYYKNDNEYAPLSNKQNLYFIISIIFSIGLYMLSRFYSIEEYAGATSSSFFEVVVKNPFLLVSMFIKSFASELIGIETLEAYKLTGGIALVIGIIIIAIYAYAIYNGFRHNMYRRNIFPLILILTGIINHAFVVLMRWRFLRDTYAMSSRYTIQYQVGAIGVLLTLMLLRKNAKYTEEKLTRKKSICTIALLTCLIYVGGAFITNADEIKKAPYRKESFMHMQELAMDYDNVDDKTLSTVFGYHDGARVRKALDILKDNKLNIYRN